MLPTCTDSFGYLVNSFSQSSGSVGLDLIFGTRQQDRFTYIYKLYVSTFRAWVLIKIIKLTFYAISGIVKCLVRLR